MADDKAGSQAPQGSPTATAPASAPESGSSPTPPPAGAQPAAAAPAPAGQPAAAAPAAPAYQPFQAPEGIKLEGPVLEEFTKLAQASGLNQEQAQQLVNLMPGLAGQFATAAEAALTQQHDAQIEAWKAASIADKKIGEAGVAAAQAAFGRFLSPEAKAVLEASGLENHPEIVRSFMAIGAAISEDVHVGSGPPREPPKTSTEVRYNHPDSQALLKH